MTTEELKENPFTIYQCKPKRNCVLSINDTMSMRLMTTQKWTVIYTYNHRNGRDFSVERNNLGLTLYMTESEFNENFEFR